MNCYQELYILTCNNKDSKVEIKILNRITELIILNLSNKHNCDFLTINFLQYLLFNMEWRNSETYFYSAMVENTSGVLKDTN